MKRVFVSYRRNDTAREAHVLKTVLEERVRDAAVFIDTDDISIGSVWPERLERELERASAVIVLVGPDWRGGAGAPDRLLEDNDWVRREIEIALASKPGRVLPVVVEDATRHMQDLPASISTLSDLQSTAWNSARWDDDVQRIAVWTAGVLGSEMQLRGDAYPKPDQIKRLFPPLTETEIERMLASGGVDGWSVRESVVPGESARGGHELHKVFEFSNFKRAFSFMEMVAIKAEHLNHHPDWHNVWNRVEINLRTWDAGHVITVLDFQMAAFMNQAGARCSAAKAPKWPPRPD